MAAERFKPINEIAELCVLESGRLPDGVSCWKSYGTDVYTGKKQSLIDGGYASACWFPGEPLPPSKKRPGMRRCNFKIDTAHGVVKLFHQGKGRWRVSIPIHAFEVRRRDAEAKFLSDRERREEEQKREREEEQQRHREEA